MLKRDGGVVVVVVEVKKEDFCFFYAVVVVFSRISERRCAVQRGTVGYKLNT